MFPDITLYKELEKTTKDQIVNLLSYDWPLSLNKIHNILKKRYKKNTSYQATFKAIKDMLSKKIIQKSKEGYSLNLDWIKNVHNQTEIIRANYYSQGHSSLIIGDSESLRTLVFEKWFDVEKYLYYLQKNYILNSKEREIICVYHHHEWRPIFYLRAEYNWINEMNSLGHGLFVLCSGNKSLDKWAANFYKSIHVKLKLGYNFKEPFELLVFGDLIVQVYIPFELQAKLDKIFNSQNLDELNHKKIIKEIFEKETEIKVIINKDKKLAREIKNQTLNEFK